MGIRVYGVGDRVIACAGYDGNDDIIGIPGTIIVIDGNDRYSVVYDDDVGGHDLEGRCDHGYGWHTHERVLKPYKDPDPVITMSYEEVMA